jgi:2-dehydropantoate 2-reductase
VTDDAASAALGDRDVVVLAMKSQDTVAALDALVLAAPPTIHLVCAQNGVANERAALRRFENVHAMCVMCPATHLAPGRVTAHSAPLYGGFDVGRYPFGLDEVDRYVAAAITDSSCSSEPRDDVMPWKYAKLLRNLENVSDALFGQGEHRGAIGRLVREEGEAVLAAAGLDFTDDETFEGRHRNVVTPVSPPGATRHRGGSTWQSLVRGSGGVETDYLNGEIALLARLHGVAAPANQLLQTMMHEAIAQGRGAVTTEADEFHRRLDALRACSA